MDSFKKPPLLSCFLGLMVLSLIPPNREGDKPLIAAEFRKADETFESELFVAIEMGDEKAVQEFLEKEPRSVRGVEPFGITPLHVAARHGRVEILDLLVEQGAVVDDHRHGGEGTPLYEAVKSGQTAAARRLLDHGANARARSLGSGSETLLTVAVGTGNVEMVKLLLNHGADINGNSKQGDWPLLKAVQSRQLDAVRFLLEQGTDVEAVDKDGWGIIGRIPDSCPPEIIALLKQHIRKRDLLAAVRLGEAEAVKEILSKQKRTPEEWESQSFLLLETAIRAKHAQVLELLLEAGAKVNRPTGRWRTQTIWNVLADLRSRRSTDHAGLKLVLSEHGAMPLAVLRPPLDLEPLAPGNPIEFAHFHYFPGGGVWVEERDLYWSIRNVDGRKFTEMEFDEGDVTVHVVDDPGETSGVTLTRYADGKWNTEKLKDTAEFQQKYPKLLDIYDKKNTRVGFHQAQPNQIRGDQFVGKWMSTGPGSSHVDPEEAWMYSLRTAPVDQVEVKLEERPKVAQHADKDGVTPLHHAADAGRLDVVKLLVESGADVNAHSKRYGAPLHYAVASGNAELVKWLLDHKANPSPRTDTRLTPLHQAAAAGNKTIVDHLLKANAAADIQLLQPTGATPLSLAAQGGHLAIVQRLWEHDPENALTKQQADTALEEAIEHGQQKVGQWLVRQGTTTMRFPSISQLDAKQRMDPASVELAVLKATAPYCIDGVCELGRLDEVKRYLPWVPGLKELPTRSGERHYAPVQAAIRGNQIGVLRFLMEDGVPFYNVNFHSYGLEETGWGLAMSQGNTDIAKVLIDRLPDPDTVLNRNGERPMHSAARFGRTDVLRILLRRGAKIHLGDESGSTALHRAAGSGQVEAVKFLLDKGARLDAEDRSGNTPLHSGASHAAVVEELLRRGAKPDAANQSGQSPMDRALMGGHTDSVKKFVEAGADVDIFVAVMLGDVDRVQELTAKDSDILQQRKFHGRTPFLHAVALGQAEIAELLLKQDPKQIKATCDAGKTALHYAVNLSRLKPRDEGIAKLMVLSLLEHGAEINVLDSRGETPTDGAWRFELRELLEKRGGKRGSRLRSSRPLR